MSDNTRTIKVEALARVEGEGAFRVKLRNGRVTESEFRIFEPPRYFEALLEGRSYRDAPDVTSRICGICPI
ncbi:MAG: Ni/Fe hydrogenase subunit alpha, partial [Rhodospirillales bacterium]|nr:Ni/Fe hydrogenase subunit alpha [Rhodospirillales bacterium]